MLGKVCGVLGNCYKSKNYFNLSRIEKANREHFTLIRRLIVLPLRRTVCTTDSPEYHRKAFSRNYHPRKSPNYGIH